MKVFCLLLVVVLFASVFSSCQKEEENNEIFSDDIMNDSLMVNEWISELMEVYYLWNDEMLQIAPDSTTDPIDYFYSLLYTEEDKWSFITDDFEGLMASFEGVSKTNGIAPSLISFEASDRVAILVLYAYKNSPAADAGIQRGDWITEIDGVELNESNYLDLYDNDAYTATLSALVDGDLVEKGTADLESVVLNIDPVVFDTVYYQGSMKIGYMYLSEFTYIDNFSQNVSAAFNRLGSDLDHLIIDLRYNGGGALSSASWLASSLAPQSVVENNALLVKLQYNSILESEFTEEDKNYNLDKTDFSYDFQKITILANYTSASASELLIMGLDPYMEVDHIGEDTYGKYTASIPMYDLNDPVQHNYGIFPIVAKYANANGFTDFKDGLVPDFTKQEGLADIRPLGSLDDLLIRSAYQRITGVYPNTAKSQSTNTYKTLPFKVVENSNFARRKELIID